MARIVGTRAQCASLQAARIVLPRTAAGTAAQRQRPPAASGVRRRLRWASRPASCTGSAWDIRAASQTAGGRSPQPPGGAPRSAARAAAAADGGRAGERGWVGENVVNRSGVALCGAAPALGRQVRPLLRRQSAPWRRAQAALARSARDPAERWRSAGAASAASCRCAARSARLLSRALGSAAPRDLPLHARRACARGTRCVG